MIEGRDEPETEKWGVAMISWLTKMMPNKWVVYLWKKLPLPKQFRNRIVYRGNPHFIVAVLGVILNEKGEVLLLHHTYRDQPWGVPSGIIEREHPADAMVREMFEETKFQIEVERILHAGYTPQLSCIDLVYKARIVGGTFQASPEVSDYGFYPVGEWPEGMPSKQKHLVEEVLRGEFVK